MVNLHPGTLLRPLDRVRLGARFGAGSPAQVPGLVAWYKNTDDKFLTLATSAITQNLDLSGNGNHTAVQGTSTNRPTRTLDVINGLQSALFDGDDDLDIPSGLFSIPSGPNTIFIVAKRDTEAAANEALMWFSEVGVTNDLYIRYGSAAGTIEFSHGGTAIISTGNINTSSQVITCRRSGTTQGISVNGSTEVTNTNAIDGASTDKANIGAATTPSQNVTGAMHEILIYNSSLSASQIAFIEVGLADEYGTYHPSATWINNYSASVQLMIHAAKLNLDHPYVQNAQVPSVWYDTTNSAFVTLVSTAVTQLLDKSGNEIDSEVQGTAAARPTFTAAQQNGLSGAVWDGAGDLLEVATTTLIDNLFAGGGTVFIVHKPGGAGEGNFGRMFEKTSSHILFMNSPSGGATGAAYIRGRDSAIGDWRLDTRPFTDAATTITALTYDSDSVSNNPVFRVNGAVVGNSENSTPVGDLITDAGTNLGIGNRTSADRTYNGAILEIVIFPTALSGADTAISEGVFADKYNITLS